jgi:hypothetical protein
MDEKEFNYIREAVQEKHDRLMEKLVLHKTKPKISEEEEIAFEKHWKDFEYIFPEIMPKWGLKDDGTPKKTRGRPRKETL